MLDFRILIVPRPKYHREQHVLWEATPGTYEHKAIGFLGGSGVITSRFFCYDEWAYRVQPVTGYGKNSGEVLELLESDIVSLIASISPPAPVVNNSEEILYELYENPCCCMREAVKLLVIEIPPNVPKPKYTIGQQTEHGIICGIQYLSSDSNEPEEGIVAEGWWYWIGEQAYCDYDFGGRESLEGVA